MGLDTSIYSQIQQPKIDSPLEVQARVQQFQQGQQQNKLAQMTLSEKQRELNENELTRSVYSQNADPGTRLNALAKVSPRAYQAEAKFQSEQQKEARATEKAKLENGLKHFEVVGQIMNGVQDQVSYDAARQRMAQTFGPESVANLSPTFDAATVERNRQQAMSVKEQLEQKWKAISDNRDERKFSYQQTNDADTRRVTVRGQDLSASTARRGQDIGASTTMRGQDMSSATAAAGRSQAESHFQAGQDKGQYDADRGLLINPRTGVGRPVVGSDGVALGGKDKLTEDQGKATGWLVQAENAFKNMRSATETKPSASKPGFPDMVAGVPSFGIGGAVGNMMRGTERQKFMQGSSSLGEALLRAATGAGVNKDEAVQKIRELTPVFGDDDATIQQKMDAIPLYIDSLKVRAGPGAGKAAAIAAKAKTPNINDLLKKYGD